MYVFATVMLLGLALAKLVDLVRTAWEMPRGGRLLLAFAGGLLLTWVTDYSAFAAWDQAFRAGWMGPVATGLALGGVAAFWHELLDLIASTARRVHDQATEIETRIPRAA
ncbi:MAG TPA: hypothetical protein VNO17_08175 [Actinomycetota bacterium]|nr:hypothetical protein [Actinomycetota bacterium]